MEEADIIGIDLAKRSFQVHGARADGSVAYRRKLSRAKLAGFIASRPRCTVAMEACGGAHYWGREIQELGHEVRLVPPIYVKPFVKRQKNDAADAEAITEAGQRPTMHFVAVKTEAQQAQAMLLLRGHLAEFGVVAPQGTAHVGRLAEVIDGRDSGLPEPVLEMGRLLLDGGRPTGNSARGDIGPVAGRDASAQTEDAGLGSVSQQDGTDRLGADHEKGVLPGSRHRLSGRRKEKSEREVAVGTCGQGRKNE